MKTDNANRLADPENLRMCKVLRHLTVNKNNFLKLIKPKWLPQPRFRSHLKTDNANRLADPQKIYIPVPGFNM